MFLADIKSRNDLNVNVNSMNVNSINVKRKFVFLSQCPVVKLLSVKGVGDWLKGLKQLSM